MLAICLRAATVAGTAFYGYRLAPSMRPNAWKDIRGIYWLCYRDLGGVDGGHHTNFFFFSPILPTIKILTFLFLSLLQLRTIRKRACSIYNTRLFIFFLEMLCFWSGIFSQSTLLTRLPSPPSFSRSSSSPLDRGKQATSALCPLHTHYHLPVSTVVKAWFGFGIVCLIWSGLGWLGLVVDVGEG